MSTSPAAVERDTTTAVGIISDEVSTAHTIPLSLVASIASASACSEEEEEEEEEEEDEEEEFEEETYLEGTSHEYTSTTSASRAKPKFEIGTIIHNKWQVIDELGKGGCGVVYMVKNILEPDTETNKAAMKAECVAKQYDDTVAAEINLLSKMEFSKYACRLLSASRCGNFDIVVMSLTGENLSCLRRQCPQQRMTFSTAIRIAYHCLGAIDDLHSIGFVHRDIKASNFAVGYFPYEARHIKILDFGFARSYLAWNGERLQIRRPRPRTGFLGTIRYCSLSAHRREEQGRADDLWSWLFMLVEFMYGKLPWKKLRRHIGAAKEAALPHLFAHGPVEFYGITDHLLTLGYASRPNYAYIRKIIYDICAKRRYYPDDPYDWEEGGAYYKYIYETEESQDATTTGSVSTSMTGSNSSVYTTDTTLSASTAPESQTQSQSQDSTKTESAPPRPKTAGKN